jgi:hypothetical protein
MSLALCSESAGGGVANSLLLILFGSTCVMVAVTVESMDFPNR